MKNKAFTLAEVLVTLTVIGVVSAMTIPTLMNKNKEVQTVAAVKSAYTILGNAIKRSEIDNGEAATWDFGSQSQSLESAITTGGYLQPYLKTIKVCNKKINTNEKCLPEKRKSLNGTLVVDPSNNYGLILNNGMSMGFWGGGESMAIVVDINAEKGPNQWGFDTFEFVMNKNKTILYPNGANIDISTRNIKNHCRYKTDTDEQNGDACTAWVIYKGNMDYLKKQVSWDE